MVLITHTKNHMNDFFKGNRLPILRYVGHINNQPEWRFPTHKHDNLTEIIFISEGEGTFIINDKTYIAKQGDILVYNSGVIHEEFSNPSNPLKTFFCGVGDVFINDKEIEEGNIISSNTVPVISTGIHLQEMESFISSMFKETSLRSYGFEIICQNLLISVIILITRIINTSYESLSTKNSKSISSQIKKYIENNYSQNITLQDIAQKFFISQDYASHIFKKEVNYSPIQYLINCRIGEAKRLLLTTDMRIHEIAQQVGYDNPNYFAMKFKGVANETPTDFRRNNTKIDITSHGKHTFLMP